MGSDTHANNIYKLSSCGDHTACLLHEIWEQLLSKEHQEGVFDSFSNWFIYLVSLLTTALSNTQHSFRIIQSHNWQKVYFLKRSLSSITPSEVVWRVSLSISMHSFNRGSDVRNPVDLSAYYNETAITKWKDCYYNQVIYCSAFITVRDLPLHHQQRHCDTLLIL